MRYKLLLVILLAGLPALAGTVWRGRWGKP